MYHRNMVVCPIVVITIFSRAKHINCCGIIGEYVNLIAYKCGYASFCLSCSYKWK